MATFTSSLPEELLAQLSAEAQALALPKNKIIEKALRLYLKHLTRAKYIRSYKQMADDENILTIAEEGMAEYLTQVNDNEK